MRRAKISDTWIVIGVLAAVLIAGVGLGVMFFGGPLFTADNAAPPAAQSGPVVKILSSVPAGTEVQKVTISAQGLTYTPYPVVLKVGVPAEVTLDLGIRSCLAAMVFPAGGIRLLATPGRNVAYFIPEIAGDYPFSCSMNMGRGMFRFQ